MKSHPAVRASRHWLTTVAVERQRTMAWFNWGLALSYLCALLSVALQAEVLVGDAGLQPLASTAVQVRRHLGDDLFWRFPSLLLWWPSATGMIVVCLLGSLAALLYAVGWWRPLTAACAWLATVSVIHAGGRFLSFQWDILLAEVGFLAIWLYPLRARSDTPPNPWVVLLLWWLCLRLMVASGAVKLLSGDLVWRDWSALSVHFETTPLPGPLNWYAHHLPSSVQRSLTGLTFFVELAVPWLILAGRPFRRVAAVLFITLMLGIAATGNYAYFNLLTVVLAIALLDDGCRVIRPEPEPRRAIGIGGWQGRAVAMVALLIWCLSWVPFSRVFPVDPPRGLVHIYQTVRPFFITNGYGLFANMTEQRPELGLEWTVDGRAWHIAHLRHKPGDPAVRPAWVAPHQPRIDWQFWFAALGQPRQNPWVFSLLHRLCQASPAALQLLANPPKAPGQVVAWRARRRLYTFTSPAERASSGQWWRIGPQAAYGPPAECRPSSRSGGRGS